MQFASRIGFTCVANMIVVGSVAIALNDTVPLATPGALAVIALAPTSEPSVSTVDAWPRSSVVALPSDSDPLPLAISNVTATPDIGAWFPSFTIATNGRANVVPISPLWFAPDATSMVGPLAGGELGALPTQPPPTIVNTNPIARTQRVNAANMATPDRA